MPRFNRLGWVVSGVGDNIVSVFKPELNETIIIGEGSCACWLDDAQVIYGGPYQGRWALLVYDLRTGKSDLFADVPIDFIVGSNGEWAATGPSGYIGSHPLPPNTKLALPATDNRGAADRDGTIAFTDETGQGFTLVTPGLPPAPGAPGFPAYGLAVIGPGKALWPDGRGAFATLGLPAPAAAGAPGRACYALVNGRAWVVYQAEGLGLIAHPADDASQGIVVETGGRSFHYDAIGINGTIRVCWSTTTAERPEQLVVRDLDLSALVPLTKPFVFPPFNHKVLIAVFKDLNGESGSPAEIVVNQMKQAVERPYFVAEDSLDGPFLGERLGVYSEAVVPTFPKDTRLMLCHDSSKREPWTLPAGMRPWDIPTIELYRYEGEVLTEAVEWWRRDVQHVLSVWPGDVALVPQFYTMNIWPVSEVLNGLEYLVPIANMSSRIKVVAPFSWTRANGIERYKELQDAFTSLLKATPGIPTLTPIPPKPDPEPPKPDPPPVSLYLHHRGV